MHCETINERMFSSQITAFGKRLCGMWLCESRQSYCIQSLGYRTAATVLKLVTLRGQCCGEVTWLCLQVVVGLLVATLVRLMIKNWNGKGMIFFSGEWSEWEGGKRYTHTLCHGWVGAEFNQIESSTLLKLVHCFIPQYLINFVV